MMNIFKLKQHALDQEIDRLVQESPVPQIYLKAPQVDFGVADNRLEPQTSGLGRWASAKPLLSSYATSSPLAQRYDPFLSSQRLNSSFPSVGRWQTPADIFNNLKNQSVSETDQSTQDVSHDSTAAKENTSLLNGQTNEENFLHWKQVQPSYMVRSHQPLQQRSVLNSANIGNNQTADQSLLQSTAGQSHPLYSVDGEEDEENVLNAITLFMWNIKPVPGTHSICVEGKKSILEDNFWHSGIIIRRITASVVETKTGSVYKLEGKMELLAAMEEGFSQKTAEAFWLGFPEDWEIIIQDYFRNASLNKLIQDHVRNSPQDRVEENELSDSDIEISPLDEIDDDNIETGLEDIGDVSLSLATLSAEEGHNETTTEKEEVDNRILTDTHTKDLSVILNPAAKQKKKKEKTRNDVPDIPSSEDKRKKDGKTVNDVPDLLVNHSLEDRQKKKGKMGNDVHISVDKQMNKRGMKKKEMAIKTLTYTGTNEVFSPIDKLKNKGKGVKEKETVLKNWIIKPLPNGKGIHIVGSKLNDVGWHSSAVEKRLDKRLLLSSSGSVYRLKGPMDKLVARDEGLPVEIVNKFSSGFPKEWQELVQEHICTKLRKKSRKTKNKKSKPTSRAEVDKGGKRETSDVSERQKGLNRVNDELVHTDDKKGYDSETNTEHVVRSTYTGFKNKQVAEPYERNKIVLTPNGEMVDLETLGRSRSGRLIKPPLQWWTGQTLETDGESIKVKAPTLAASMFLQEFEDGYKKSRRKLKHYFNPRQKDKDYSSFNSSKLTLNSSISSVDSKSSIGVADMGQLTDSVIAAVDSMNCADIEQDDKLKDGVNYIIEKSKKNRKTVQKRNTCYGSNCKTLKAINEIADDPYDLNADETEEDEVVGKKTDAKSSRHTDSRKHQKKLEKVEQKNDSLGTGDTEENIKDMKKTLKGKGHNETIKVGIDKSRKCTDEVVKVPGNTGLKDSKMTSKTKSVKSAGKQQSGKICNKDLESNTCEIKSGESEEIEEVVTVRSLRSRAVKKALPVITETDVECSDSDYVPDDAVSKKRNSSQGKGSVTRKQKKGKENVGRKENMENELQVKDESHWTKEEKEKLMEACKLTAPNQAQYWEKVAEKVQTKSAEACRIMYYGEEKEPKSADKKKKKNKEKPRATGITANKGTLKRRQQLLDLLNQHDEDYSDDLFDSTPFRVTRKRKIPVLSEEEDEIFEKLAKRQGKSRFETPVTMTAVGRRVVAPFASSKKTPVSTVVVETDEDRADDIYVHRLMKRRLLAKGQKKKKETPEAPRKVETETSPQQKLFFDKLMKEKKDTSENFHDSDQEEDLYWEDASDNGN